MPRLLSLGPFNLTGIGQQFLIMDPAQIGGGPDQVGQVAIYNYSSFLVGVTYTNVGAQLDLQPGTAMVYDPPPRGGQLVGTVKSGSASTASSVVTAQVALDGARIEGAWPQTLSSAALLQENPTYVIVPDPPAGQDWKYVLPNQSRLVAVRATFTANHTQLERRLPYLWQVVSGDTNPTEETLLSPFALGAFGFGVTSTSDITYVINAVSGLGSQQVRDTPVVPYIDWLPSPSGVIYTSVTYLKEAELFLFNASAGTATYAIALQGNDFANGSLSAGESITLDVPNCVSGAQITAVSSVVAGVWAVLSGTENFDNRSVIGFEGLLLPAGSSIQSATGGLQSLDQWSNIQLAFTSG
jgi:hypothetical protein